jgi:predicted dehydrogenase
VSKIASKYKCSYYDDYRQMIIQDKYDCVISAAPLHNCIEHLKSALKRGFNVLKTAPLGRNFEEAMTLYSLAESNNVKFAVINPYRFAQSFTNFSRVLAKKDKIFLINGSCFRENKAGKKSWVSDRHLAGGGVVLYDCYQIIDQLVLNFGLPEQVYSLKTNKAPDRKQRYYLTEDTALLTMKFSDTRFAHITASNRPEAAASETEIIKVHADKEIFAATPNSFTVSKGDGTVIEHNTYKDKNTEWVSEFLNNFALSIISPDQHKLISSAAENLKNMALIESAYLSASTAMPEQPEKMLQLSEFQVGTP